MKIAPFWAKESYSGTDKKGKNQRIIATGWSFYSLEHAKGNALDRARKIFEIIVGGNKPNTYADYLDRPLREEIVESVTENTKQIGLITRNRYGALVLNSANVLFADVDFPAARPMGIFQTISWLFSPSKLREKQRTLENQTIDRIKTWVQANPSRYFRLYRTCVGLRLLFTDKLYSPASDETKLLLDDLQSDSLYKRLTIKQECFRARLTPKPWRCGCKRPPVNYPWSDSNEEQKYRQWEKNYDKIVLNYKTCELMEQFGPSVSDVEIRKVIAIHDRWTCQMNQKPLA
jgi:hypothetical protein